MEPKRTVDAMFRAAAHRFPERSFIRCANGERRSYAEATRSIDAITEALQALGVAVGQRVVFYLEEPVPSTLFNLACSHLGIIPVPFSASFSSRALVQLVERVDAKLVITTATHAAAAAGTVPVVCMRDAELPAGAVGVDETPRRSYADALARLTALARHSTDAPYLYQPTSGTTGEPKLIIRSHRVFDRVARVIAAELPAAEAEPQSRILLVAALTHGLGQYLLATSLHLAAELCITTELDTAASLEEIRALDPSILGLTPRVIRSLYAQRKPGDPHWFGRGAKVMLVGGAGMPQELVDAVEQEDIALSEAYGASEISLLTQTRLGHYRVGMAGEVLPDVSLRIADDGELLAKSPDGVMTGYFGDETLTREAFTEDGYYRTGDYAEITSDGLLRILGRKKDVFNTNEGANVHPARIETMLEALPWVRQVVLVGDQRPYIAALIVVDPATMASTEPDGYLDETQHAASYERSLAALAPINETLEVIERVRRIALFDRPFPEAGYKVVGHGKTSRNRRVMGERYSLRISALYPKG
jgi:long-chain acyl-CoA synthetase